MATIARPTLTLIWQRKIGRRSPCAYVSQLWLKRKVYLRLFRKNYQRYNYSIVVYWWWYITRASAVKWLTLVNKYEENCEIFSFLPEFRIHKWPVEYLKQRTGLIVSVAIRQYLRQRKQLIARLSISIVFVRFLLGQSTDHCALYHGKRQLTTLLSRQKYCWNGHVRH